MNNTTGLVKTVILALVLTTTLPVTAFVGQVLSVRTAESPVDEAIASSYMEMPYRKAPLSILAYIEYTDLSPGGEYDHVRAAIDAEYGLTYQWDEFNNSADLASLLPGNDVLLIMEQENAYRANISAVATSWSSILNDYVTAGGVVVLMDFFAVGGEMDYGVTAILYNETGLMSLYEYEGIAYEAVDLTNSSNALARGVSSTFVGADGTIAFRTDVGIPVVSYQADHDYHVVVDRILGKGHAVLLGFDMYERSTNFDVLLANSLRLPWHVVFDESHSPTHTVLTGHSSYADDLVAAGFAVSWITALDPEYLAASDVLIIGYSDDNYTGDDIAVLHDFVNQGKGLFISTEWADLGNYSDALLQSFGFERYNSALLRDIDNFQNYTANVYYSGANLVNGSCNLQVLRVEMPGGTGFLSMPEGARTIIMTDTDNTTKWGSVSGPGALGVPVAGSANYGVGRVFVIGDTNIMDDSGDSDYDGDVNYRDSDNDVFLVNSIRWLFGAGVKERTILVDQSKSPLVSISSTIAAWRMLTMNGFNVKWMSSFKIGLLDEVNVLVVIEGSVAYTAEEVDAIVAFVERGGGLLMFSDWGEFGTYVGAIAERFGLIREPSRYLEDTDDFIVYDSYLMYDGSNIQTHPITSRVSRVEVDRSGALLEIGGAASLIVTDSDNTSLYDNGTVTGGLAVFAALEHGLGRAVFFPDVDFWGASIDPESDGWMNFYDSDNDVLTANSFWWLAENRAPVVTVTYPDGGEAVEDTVLITWNAIEPNLDDMVFQVEYSLDGGSTWTPMMTGIHDLQYSWNTASLTDGVQYLIRVTVSDSVFETSDTSDGPFTVDNNAPIITNVAHAPVSPAAAMPVAISADVVDVTAIVLVECSYSTDGGSTWTVKTMSLSSGDLFDCSLGSFNASTTVTYRIRATDAMGHVSDWTAEQQFTIPAPFNMMLLVIIAGAAIGILVLVVLLRKRNK